MDSQPLAPLTVVVLTHNEEWNLPACLARVAGWAKEIFVVDSGSTDRTREIASQYGAIVVEHRFETHAKQWNWALQNLPISTEWILALDADQRVTPELRDEISELFNRGALDVRLEGVRSQESGARNKQLGVRGQGKAVGDQRSGLDDIDGFYIKRRQIFRGTWIKHGGYYPKYLLKFFRRGQSWLDEGELADHRFYVAGKSALLGSDLIEDNQNEADILVWMKKHVVYAGRQAKEEFLRRQNGMGWSVRPSLFGTPDQRILWLKRIWYRMPIYVRPFVYFFYRYFVRLGFLDGRQGLLFHFLQAFWYRIMVDVVLDDLRRRHSFDESVSLSPDAGQRESRRQNR